MTRWLLAGGGTAGHVNPLLAVADELVDQRPDDEVLVLGTAEGLEARLVPERGLRLATIPKVVFPRRPDAAALRFPARLRAAVGRTRAIIAEERIDAVIGFGGYASAPAYLAARRDGLPLSVHEANARPGLANRLGARRAAAVGVAFRDTALPRAEWVGMPLRREIARLDRAAVRGEALAHFDLSPDAPVLLLTGGSLGAKRLNDAVLAAAPAIVAAGWQVLHQVGERSDAVQPDLPGYRMLRYLDRMDLALAVADLAVGRAGAGTVCELSALGVPAVYVPLPIGNGEQRLNAAGVVAAGGGVLIDDADFTAATAAGHLAPLLADRDRIAAMAVAAAAAGTRDGSAAMVALAVRTLGGAR